ncbi:pheromone A receptor-domain-containing protein [Crucibulum laeve]|uniref:Pheromone A receptor-domain-containing protein n=1 Tax=Crucibulum laeve TaxID=68775 RepID=A0A5C3LKY2_9AGAR|nr:pheromone A receptor-domain-containing protein [Crucibulum laeve]
MSYPNFVYSIFAFIGFLLCAIPFPWHLEAWNTGTCLYMAWTGLACLNQFINSVVWDHTVINKAPVWCDISSRFIIGSTVAIPAASLCINRRLYHIASVRSVTITKAEKRRAIMVDLAIGLGLPILEMILQYIPQGHRFNILENVGCYPFTYDTWVAYVIVSAPPIIIGMVSAVYCVLSIRAFNKSRAQFNELLSGNKNLTSSRYVRLMCLAGVEVLCTVPLASYIMYLNIVDGVNPWISWADTHYGFSRVDTIPAILWRSQPVAERAIEMSRWLIIACAILFFGFFGFADEARKNYRSFMQTVTKSVGLSTVSFGNSSGITSSTGGEKSKNFLNSFNGRPRPVLPINVHREFLQKRDSLDSFTDVSVSFADVGNSLNEKEKPFSPDASFGALTLTDVGGTLADYDSSPYSPAPSSGSSSASSISYPEPAVTRPDSVADIEISSVRHASVSLAPATIISAAQRALDAPVPRHSHDIV